MVGVLLRYSNFEVPELVRSGADISDSLATNATLVEQASSAASSLALAIDSGRTDRARAVLTPALRRAIVSCYCAGQSGRVIAKALGIAKTTVIAVVRDAGVPLRNQRLSADQRAEVVRLYKAGATQVSIAKKLDLHKGHVWHVLERAGLVGENIGHRARRADP